ncbi:hypothetical protein [Mucilaginibacter sp. L196]|uniref:hypothetical protein n=1 Tax=Mucilaginibacter sp. L196 TaxID=1641870 RepID=UPI00131BC4C3|nr:hypothetical protein [Mucilaginibacter sp. L196]
MIGSDDMAMYAIGKMGIGVALQVALYHGTSGTTGTFGTLLAKKTPETTLKSPFLPTYLAAFRAKNTQFRPQKALKNTHFSPFFAII